MEKDELCEEPEELKKEEDTGIVAETAKKCEKEEIEEAKEHPPEEGV